MERTRLGKVLRGFFWAVLATLLVIQFFSPTANNSNDQTNIVSRAFETPDQVVGILKTSCFDCHSNLTIYPWYSKVQPIAWWLDDHIVEGKKEMNFSEFAAYSPRRQFKKFNEIIEQIEEDEMPLSSFTLVHQDAKLSADQKSALVQWAKTCQEKMKQQYPIDSLQKKKG